jgi:putative flippase GtrA
MLRLRLVRFGIVGVAATLVHGLVLFALSSVLRLDSGLSNLLGFITAFVLSVNAQQAFTFADRLDSQRLNARAVSILFAINAVAAFYLGGALQGWAAVVLPLVPAGINYVLYYLFSGRSSFKSQSDRS